MNEKPEAKQESPSSPPDVAGFRRKVVRTRDLLGGSVEIILLHGEKEYRLRATRNGKLILTK
jgi:hemin uptake protein HemP